MIHGWLQIKRDPALRRILIQKERGDSLCDAPVYHIKRNRTYTPNAQESLPCRIALFIQSVNLLVCTRSILLHKVTYDATR
jgi:hypothetical protein